MRGEGPLKIIGYTDFFSPESAAFSTVVPQIASQFGNDIVVENNAFVPDVPSAYVAEAVQCGVEMQKIIDTRESYMAAINKMIEGKKELTQEDFSQLSDTLKGILGIEGKTAECYDRHDYLVKVQQITAEAQALGISGAPAYFVGNRFLAGPQSADTFTAVIQEVMAERASTGGKQQADKEKGSDAEETPVDPFDAPPEIADEPVVDEKTE